MFADAVIARRPGAQINKLEHQWLEGLAARFGSFQWTPWAPSAIQRGRPPRAREDAEPIRVGAVGREHLLMAPPAAAPAAAPATAAEPSVPTPATESSAAAAHPSSSSSAPSPAAGALDREVEMANPVPDRKRDHSAVDRLLPQQVRMTAGRWLSRTSVSDSRMRSQWWQQSAKMSHPLSGMKTRSACGSIA